MDMISQPNPNIGGNFPIVALVNDFSVSCGEILPIAVKSLRNGYLVGTQTWGATGPHFQDDSPGWTNGGCFTHNKFWTQVYETGYELRALDYTSYEGVGVPPDKKVPFSCSAFTATPASSAKDAQLQAAIDAASAYIKSGVYPAP
jgi:C-terminal processing protease CtpA/Prc